ncbi:hypothetical protein ACE01N_19890 [Saccharicrinis sp. FJH2]|uniref:hypothetical protein n=1 Tax=Saccharicrinis sp. FJH65 TaxID=3344659 RepID=UPI0035F45A9A
MNRSIYIMLLLLFITKIYGQDKYLNPCIGLSTDIEQIKRYNEDLDKIINSKLSTNYKVRFIAQPSFSSEYCFQIEKDSLYKIQSIIFQENLWSSKNRDSVRFQHFENIINYNLALKIDDLFDKITSSAMNRNEYFGGGEDGQIYIFYKQTETGEKNCGECWSPSEGTPLFELVSICNTLINLSKNENSDNTNLNVQIDKLYNDIE